MVQLVGSQAIGVSWYSKSCKGVKRIVPPPPDDLIEAVSLGTESESQTSRIRFLSLGVRYQEPPAAREMGDRKVPA